MESKELAAAIQKWMEDKNAQDIKVIDIQNMTPLADYMIVCSGNSERQVKAIADNIEYEADKLGVYPKSVEGNHGARWILMDYIDVIVHVFHQEERSFYDLERLWKNSLRPSQEEN